MLLPKYQLLVHSILKQWMALKTRSEYPEYPLLFISKQLASFVLSLVYLFVLHYVTVLAYTYEKLFTSVSEASSG